MYAAMAGILGRMAAARGVDAVLITGGTGMGRRDQTPEAVSPLLTRPLPGYGELLRMLSYREIGPAAMLSRQEPVPAAAEQDVDLLVVNDATEAGAGFDVDTNRVTLLARGGGEEERDEQEQGGGGAQAHRVSSSRRAWSSGWGKAPTAQASARWVRRRRAVPSTTARTSSPSATPTLPFFKWHRAV